MPYFPRLIQLLLAAPQRIRAGTIQLTPAEAAMLRACDFLTATADGPWWIPELPAVLARGYPWLAQLISAERPSSYVAQPDQNQSRGEHPESPISRIEFAGAGMTTAARLRWRLGDALRQPDQCRVLDAVARRPECGVMRRRLQQNLRRLPAARFNPSLMALIKAGLVVQQTDRRLAPDPEVRRLLLEAGRCVRRSRSPRATRRDRREGTGQTRTRTSQPHDRDSQRHGQLQRIDRTTQRRYRRRPIPDRRRFPRQWGYSMRARLGGLKRQQECRRLGIHPTATATAARLNKRAQEKRRQLVSSDSTTSAAPVARMVAPEALSNVRASGVAMSITALGISEALAYDRPLGRRERLAAERNRR
jgi:hypothetical protein